MPFATMKSPLTASPAEPGSAFWQKRGMNTSPVSVLMIPALNLSVETTMDDMDCDEDEVRKKAAVFNMWMFARLAADTRILSALGHG